MPQSSLDKPESVEGRPIGEMSTIAAQTPPRSAVIPSPPGPQRFNQPGTSIAEPQHAAFQDFDLIRLLGEGSFGKVYLARQISLDRQVAVKITANRGSEARTLASLEHDHIVQVFSETIDLANNLRVLCMQYIPGTTLERLIGALNERDPQSWSGQTILDAIDSLSHSHATFHPAALRDRVLLAEFDHYQAVCWFGARLAEALAYAHSQNVLHRDIKPANILVNQYGRPLLADFNISHQTTQPASEGAFGGTLAYMAPEHLDAFHPAAAALRTTVDERSDIYSLGIVLFEMLTGKRPFDRKLAAAARAESFGKLAAERRAYIPSACDNSSKIPEVLDRIVGRCLDPQPHRRYQNPADLASALEGCRALRAAQLQLPPPGALATATTRFPLLTLPLLALLPHVLGSIVNISYNSIQIVDKLSPAQQAAFDQLVLGYNLVVYPLCVWGLTRVSLPFFRLWRDSQRQSAAMDGGDFDRVRQVVLRSPLWIVAFSCLGWLPGAVVFPVGIRWMSEPVPAEIFAHFVISFCISGLIALTYSFFGIQYATLRVFYSLLWSDTRDFLARTRSELAGVGPQLSFFQALAGCIPLFGAILLVGVGAEISAYRTFRLLVTGLILLGMAGFLLAIRASGLISRMLAAFAGIDRGHR